MLLQRSCSSVTTDGGNITTIGSIITTNSSITTIDTNNSSSEYNTATSVLITIFSDKSRFCEIKPDKIMFLENHTNIKLLKITEILKLRLKITEIWEIRLVLRKIHAF